MVTAVRLFLVRHGRTSLNAAGLLRGELDVPLDPSGETEAAELGRSFREVGLEAVVSSPLVRAVETASPLLSLGRSPAARRTAEGPLLWRVGWNGAWRS